MSKTWYPIINPEKCTGCLICARFCRQGVYTVQDGRPVVVKPVNCVHGCRGCQNKCPAGALDYAGDIGSGGKKTGCGCSCGDDCC